MCSRYGWTPKIWDEQDWDLLSCFIEIIQAKAIRDQRELKRQKMKLKNK